MTRKQLEEAEFLCGQIMRLAEARAMANAVSSSVLKGVAHLQDGMLERLVKLVRSMLGRQRLAGQAVPPKYPLEFLERLFASLRDTAEVLQAKASWAKGMERRRMTDNAMQVAEFAREAAASLRAVAEDRGVWTEAYIQEHGLGPWI